MMQINRRDYIEFQLEESGVGGGLGVGGGGSIVIGTIEDKLDYRVSMAIEKNTQLVSFVSTSLLLVSSFPKKRAFV